MLRQLAVRVYFRSSWKRPPPLSPEQRLFFSISIKDRKVDRPQQLYNTEWGDGGIRDLTLATLFQGSLKFRPIGASRSSLQETER